MYIKFLYDGRQYEGYTNIQDSVVDAVTDVLAQHNIEYIDGVSCYLQGYRKEKQFV